MHLQEDLSRAGEERDWGERIEAWGREDERKEAKGKEKRKKKRSGEEKKKQ